MMESLARFDLIYGYKVFLFSCWLFLVINLNAQLDNAKT